MDVVKVESHLLFKLKYKVFGLVSSIALRFNFLVLRVIGKGSTFSPGKMIKKLMNITPFVHDYSKIEVAILHYYSLQIVCYNNLS